MIVRSFGVLGARASVKVYDFPLSRTCSCTLEALPIGSRSAALIVIEAPTNWFEL